MTRYLVLCLLLVHCSTLSEQPFEGEVEIGLTTPGAPAEQVVVTTVKHHRTKTSIADQHIAMDIYFDYEKKRIITVIPAQHSGLEMSLDKIPKDTGDLISPAIASGRKEEISGFACEEYSWTSSGGKVPNGSIRMWLTKDIPASLTRTIAYSIESLSQGMVGGASYKALLANGYVPVRTVLTLQEGGSGAVTVTVKRIEAKPVDDAVFVIPTTINIEQIENVPE